MPLPANDYNPDPAPRDVLLSTLIALAILGTICIAAAGLAEFAGWCAS